jgi:hypothetical protein
MSDRLPAGPYRTLALDGGVEMPYYIVPFDKRGVCQGPRPRQHLVDTLADDPFSDVFLFSHGWNNDWTVATRRYEDFIEGYRDLRRRESLPFPPGYRPLLVGIFWPSTALVFGERERGPGFATAGTPEAMDEEVAAERREVEELAADLAPEQAEAFYRLAQKDALDEAEARELAALAIELRRGADGVDDELGLEPDLTVDELLRAWSAASTADDEIDDLIAGGGAGAAGAGGFFAKLDPRQIVRALTVYQMKDRAGRVGARGVGPLLRDILASSQAKVHLIGHSYGGKVVLSATSFGGDLPRKVRSMLLLQPAVSHLCFAERVPGTNPPRPGGYRNALARVESPILSTYSEHDGPLTGLFHNALRRDSDLGEEGIAAAAGNPPSKFAALGGFGPRKAGEKLIEVLDPTTPYGFEPGVPIYGIDGTRTIHGHGDISNPSTWWALHSLAAR